MRFGDELYEAERYGRLRMLLVLRWAAESIDGWPWRVIPPLGMKQHK